VILEKSDFSQLNLCAQASLKLLRSKFGVSESDTSTDDPTCSVQVLLGHHEDTDPGRIKSRRRVSADFFRLRFRYSSTTLAVRADMDKPSAWVTSLSFSPSSSGICTVTLMETSSAYVTLLYIEKTGMSRVPSGYRLYFVIPQAVRTSAVSLPPNSCARFSAVSPNASFTLKSAPFSRSSLTTSA
jgi:hypothetical protein